MAMVSGADGRRQTIAGLIAAELDRQGKTAAIDVEALANAIDAGLQSESSAADADEGRHPDELNSSNDG